MGMLGGVAPLAGPDGYWGHMGTILSPEDDYNVTSDSGRLAIWGRVVSAGSAGTGVSGVGEL